MSDLTDNDRQRIEQFANDHIKLSSRYDFIKGAEYEHKYQREQQEKKCEPSPLGLPMRPIFIRNDEMELLESECSTPGPWKTDEEEYSQYVFGPDGEMVCEMRGWGYLTGNRRKLSEKEAMEIQAANCKLIARAPELLERVKQLEAERSELRNKVIELEEEISKLRQFDER